jgi:murein DD-endopeptidase MepM/ murein hydrolase activator NlpD
MTRFRLLSLAALTGALIVLLAGAAGADPQRTGHWLWPLDSAPRIVGHYRAPLTAYSAGHRGIDLPASVGTAVHAPAAGLVAYSGTVVDRGVLSIDHAGRWRTSFEPVTDAPPVGTPVVAGQVVGRVSDEPGHCVATCLHVGLRRDGAYLNPLVMLGDLRPSVLLPLG